MKKALFLLLVLTIAGLAFLAGRTRPAETAGTASWSTSRTTETPAHIVTNPAGEPVVIEAEPHHAYTTVPARAPEIPMPGIPTPGQPRPLIIPVAGIRPSAIHDMFNEVRGNRRHEAIDILAPRGTPVIATDDGVVKKLFNSRAGGITVYQYDPDERYCYYYAHLDAYAAGLHEGQPLRRGELVGYVGTTGNAPKDTPHLHFALILLDADKRWWKGTYVNPYPLLR